ncbi:hypothetical protein Esti_001027 [Eimeria stiedai]
MWQQASAVDFPNDLYARRASAVLGGFAVVVLGGRRKDKNFVFPSSCFASGWEWPYFTFDHFELERLLGSGNFSEVFEATEKGTSKSYALKVFNRNDVMRLNKVADVRMERHAMLRLNDPGHPNVIRLLETFKDEFRVCFVYELAEGGELWEHVKYAGLMDKRWARRVISQVVSAVEYLHSKNIVHRDLKAENFVLTRDGVVKLIDLGTAMDLEHPEVEAPGLGVNRSVGTGSFGCSSRRAIRRPTFQHYVGTPQFMPPEAIKNKDSGKFRDLWSLGCTIFQILAGNPPFSGSTDYFILLRVEAGNLEFPPDFDPLARDLVERLLVADPCKRLGANGFEEIKSHPYFSPECFKNSAILGRLFPSLQELCIRKILKRFQTLVMDAMDKERQSRYSCEQAPKAGFNLKDAVLTEKRVGSHEKLADTEGEEGLVEHRCQSSSSNDDSEKTASCSTGQSEGPQFDAEFEFANHLIDEVLPRGLRDQPQRNMSPHLRILIGRLEYFLSTQGRLFSKECTLADEWDRKHSRQCAAVDEESVGSNHEAEQPDKSSNG